MEKFGISIIETLKKKDGLCIANKTSYSKGGIGETEPGLLYLTFKIKGLDDNPANILTNAQINSAVKIVMKELGLDIKEDEVVASAAKLAFEASNEMSYKGEQLVKMYSPEKDKFQKPSYSASKIKSLFS
jgi:hypothetical protein